MEVVLKFIIFILFAVFYLNSFAKESFCTSPYNYICKQQPNIREKTFNIYKSNQEKKLLKDILISNSELLSELGFYHLDQLAFDKVQYWLNYCTTQRDVSCFTELEVNPNDDTQRNEFVRGMKQIENHFNFEKKTWANKKVAELRYSMRNLFNIIRDKLIKEVKKTKMSTTAKKLALHNLEELQLVTSIDDPIIKTFHEYDQEDVIDSMRGVCGKDQLSEQAFLNDMFVTFCPGFTLRNLAMSKDNQDFVLSLIFVMAHEIGHAIDFTNLFGYGTFYKDFLMCRRDAFFKNRRDRGVRLLLSQSNEIIADYWASRVLAHSIKTYFPNFSKDELKAGMTTSYTLLCNSAQTASHPHKIFRLNHLFLQNFEIFKTFECQKEVMKYTPHFCDLEGYKDLTFGDVVQ